MGIELKSSSMRHFSFSLRRVETDFISNDQQANLLLQRKHACLIRLNF